MKTPEKLVVGSVFAALIGLSSLSTAEASHHSGSYSVEVLVGGMSQPVLNSRGQSYVAGAYGADYQIRVRNHSGQRVEAVVAVDGRDVITGDRVRPSRQRGYIVPAYGEVTVDGFRNSTATVASFQFSTIPQSYAWRRGSSWGIGTIRVWVYEESVPQPVLVVPYGPYGAPHPQSGMRSRSGAGAAEAAPSAPQSMGTAYGQQRWSPVAVTSFNRARRGAAAVLGIRYNSAAALAAAGIYPQHPTWHYPVVSTPCYGYGCLPGQHFAPPPPPVHVYTY